MSNMDTGGVPDRTTDQIIGIIRNSFGAAEGSLLPPPQKGSFRVPFITNLRVLQINAITSGTQFVLGFNEPTTSQDQLDHYTIYVGGLIGDNNQLNSVTTAQNSPVTINLSTRSIQVVTFKVQTVLKNGLVSDINTSPTCTAKTLVASGVGISGTIDLAAITGGGTVGSITVTDGIITAFVNPT